MSDVEDQAMKLPPDQTRPQRQVDTEDAGDDASRTSHARRKRHLSAV
jgi:hypothetical protein